jgi:predicted MFS family arabinose efflux permease
MSVAVGVVLGLAVGFALGRYLHWRDHVPPTAER